MEIAEKDVIIKYADDKDFLWIIEHDRHISENILKNKINNNEVYMVKYKGITIGWLRYNLFWDHTPFMNMIYFLEEYRRKGIGKILINYWENEMKKNGYKSVLTSTNSDEEAQHFYRKMGYTEIGALKWFDEPLEIMFQKIFK